MKKGIKIILSLSLIIICICFTSCKIKNYESGYFTYIYTSDDKNRRCISILGLTEEGQEQEVLVIPSMIDGYPVRGFGAYRTWSNGIDWCNFKSDKLKILYIPGQIEFVKRNIIFPENLEIFYLGLNFKNSNLVGEFFPGTTKKAFISKTIYDSNKYFSNNFDEDLLNEEKSYEKANVVYYMNNDSDNDVYFVDDVDDGKVNVIPPDPVRYIRKTMRKFLGWYKERECINPWNFDEDRIPPKEYDEEGNYIFKETSIYAKWEE